MVESGVVSWAMPHSVPSSCTVGFKQHAWRRLISNPSVAARAWPACTHRLVPDAV